MSREKIHQERLLLIVKLVEKTEIIEIEKLAAIISFSSGCSLQKAKEDIKTLVLAEQLRSKNGNVYVEKKSEEEQKKQEEEEHEALTDFYASA